MPTTPGCCSVNQRAVLLAVTSGPTARPSSPTVVVTGLTWVSVRTVPAVFISPIVPPLPGVRPSCSVNQMWPAGPATMATGAPPEASGKAEPVSPPAAVVVILPMLPVAFSVYHRLLGSPDGPAVMPHGCEPGGTTLNSLIVPPGTLKRAV